MIGGASGRVPSELSLDNWQSASHLQWTFQHIADFLPTAVISRGAGPVADLPLAQPTSAHPVVFDGKSYTEQAELGAVLHDKYNVRSVKDITSCSTCHR